MTLPTPEEMSFQLALDGWSSMDRAIRADREAIAKAVEEIRPTSDYDDAWQKGFLFACKLMLAMLRVSKEDQSRV